MKTLSPDEFRVEIGRAQGGATFMRVLHVPSGIERSVPSIGTRGSEVAKELIAKITKELSEKTVPLEAEG